MIIIDKIKFYYKEIGIKKLIIKIYFKQFEIIKKIFFFKKKFNKNYKEVFTGIYKNNYWGGIESKSGSGSSLKSTENLRLELPKIIKKLNIKSIIDIPCGDFFWLSKIITDLNVEYFGGDIVEEIIEKNNIFANDKTEFRKIDLIKDELPTGELLICRDCLFHFSFNNIEKTFKNLKKSKFKYILITNYDLEKTNIKNKDINTGSFNFLDFHLQPFNFKKNYDQKILDLDYQKNMLIKKC